VRGYQTPLIPRYHSTRSDLLRPSLAERKGVGGLLALSPLDAPASAAELVYEGEKVLQEKNECSLLPPGRRGKGRDLQHDFQSQLSAALLLHSRSSTALGLDCKVFAQLTAQHLALNGPTETWTLEVFPPVPTGSTFCLTYFFFS